MSLETPSSVPSRSPALPDRPMFHAGQTPRGSRVWAFVRQVPHHVVYEEMLNYHGFRYRDADGKSQHTGDGAYFSATKDGLIDGQVAKKRQQIADLEAEIARLEAMRANEQLVEIQTACDRAQTKLDACFEESPEYSAAWTERQATYASINAVLGKAADAMVL